MNRICKRMLTLLLVASMALGMSVTASATDFATSVSLDGQVIETNAYGDKNGRTQMPLQAVLKLGLSYKQEGNKVTYSNGADEISLAVSEAAGDTTVVDGYVPLRFIAEHFGYQVNWNGATRTAELVSTDAPTDIDSISTLEIDWSQAAQLPLTGYYTKIFESGRSIKVYIAEEASIRSYFTVVAVPDGVNTKDFLMAEGWLALADRKGECLFVLEPGANGWGSAQEEIAYMNEAMAFLSGCKNANKVTVFSTFGEFYLVGYGAGAAPLEAWAAANPILTISQAYLHGESAGNAYLMEQGSVEYGAKPNYNPPPKPIEDLDATLARVREGGGRISGADVPVPTMLIGYAAGSESLAYWKQANDCVDSALDGIYYQDINSDAYQTAYANAQVLKSNPSAKYGISQVKTGSDDMNADEIYEFLSIYSRYDNSFAYSNALVYRLDYSNAKVAAQKYAKKATAARTLSDGTELIAASDVAINGHGTIQVGIFNGSDMNGDGEKDPREYILFIPEGYEGTKLPIVYVYPGGSQTDIIFMDSTSWWQIAEEKGLALVIVCETYTSATSVTHLDSETYQKAMVTILQETIDGKYASLDFTRQYGSGQSMGSITTQNFARTNPEFYAAVATTSGIGKDEKSTGADYLAVGIGEMIPAMMINGESDISVSMWPDLWSAPNLPGWANYLLKVNGAVGDIDHWTAKEADGRYDFYTWENEGGIPVVKWGMCLGRAHNCHPEDMWKLWDYLEHFGFEVSADGTVTRYYSASAFAANDTVIIK